MYSLRTRLITFLGLVLTVFALGTAGYALIEGWGPFESLYMTVITLTTVGFGEVRPLSDTGRIFTIVLILLGVSTVAYGFGATGDYLLTTDLGSTLRTRRIRRMINDMRNHVIICGYGRVGRSAAETLLDAKHQIVIVDNDAAAIEGLKAKGIAAVLGDATKDETLLLAGIERAKSLMVCAGNDADNLFIVLSARTLCPDLYIVARSTDPDNEAKMRRAGADRVESPYLLGGRHMANIIARPRVTEFLDVVTLDGGLELWLEELIIGENSPLSGLTVVEADLRRKTGVTLVALHSEVSGSILVPNENTELEPGDELIVLGTRSQLRNLKDIIREQT